MVTNNKAQFINTGRVNYRDIEILRLIGMDGIASLKALHRKFWPNGSVRTCRARLSQLEKAGWIQGYFTDVREPGQLVFCLTNQGAKEHFSQVARKNLMVGLPAHHEIKQQSLAQQTRLALEDQLAAQGMHIVEWRNERQVRREAYQNRKSGKYGLSTLTYIADAYVCFTNNQGQTFHLEIEIDGQYFGQMLRNKILGYAGKATPTLWVTNSSRASRIRDEISRAKAANVRLLIID